MLHVKPAMNMKDAETSHWWLSDSQLAAETATGEIISTYMTG